jgi:hypothetical protein
MEADTDFEGYYRTTFKFLLGLRQETEDGQKRLLWNWNQLEDYEKANIKRALAEIT